TRTRLAEPIKNKTPSKMDGVCQRSEADPGSAFFCISSLPGHYRRQQGDIQGQQTLLQLWLTILQRHGERAYDD
ncbi:MAG: hypothetical protein V7756_18610, partial [Halopseudomonas sp.]|uniref:hypothetical protein n=1 Tax=Halopseudomonas sp. TaxID=2901191 RepID=UPI0030018A00